MTPSSWKQERTRSGSGMGVYLKYILMRVTVWVLVAVLLLWVGRAGISMSNANDKQLPALLSNKWYDLLPQRVINERTSLLKLLAPASNLTTTAIHAQQLRTLHLQKGRLNNF